MKRKCINTVSILFCSVALWGQTVITGKVVEQNTEPLQSATLLLLNASDSSYITGTITQQNGDFRIEHIVTTPCLLEISMLGFRKQSINITPSPHETVHLGIITLSEESHYLKDIVVTAGQKQIEMDAGKTVVNLSASILGSQGNVLDALKNLPGVTVREDGSIYLNGQSGIYVMVNNKQTYLSGENLANMLRALPASSVNKIELITHPSSRYDAAGNAGIINIQTKKVKLQGINISATSNVQHGKYTKGYESLFLNLQKNKFRFYMDYSFAWGKEYLILNSSGGYFDMLTGLPQDVTRDIYADRKFNHQSHYIRTGVDYDLSHRLTLGTYITSNWYKRRKNEITTSDFIYEEQCDSSLTTYNTYNTHHTNLTGGINIHFNPKENLRGDASFDFQLFGHDQNLWQHNSFTATSTLLQKDTLTGGVDGKIRIYTGQANMSYSFPEKIKLDAGVKTAFVDVNNDAAYKNLRNGYQTGNNRLGSSFTYNENIHAIYAQLNAQWNTVLSTEVGVRIENTYVKGWLKDSEKDSTFTQNYTHLFPNVIVKYLPSENHSFSLLYGRRIFRPNYRDLNPFIEVNDRYLNEKGNTELKPELTDNIEFSYFLKKQYGLSLFYSHRKHPVTKSYLVDENDVTIVTPQNLSSNHVTGIRLGLNNMQPFRWWTLHINSSIIYKQFQWTIKDIAEKNKIVTPMVHINNQLTLPCGWTAELSGFYNGKMAEGQAIIHPLWMVSAGVKKNFFKNRVSLSLYANDIFWSNQLKIDFTSPVLKGWYAEETDTRVVGVTLTYRFNSGNKIKDSRHGNRIDESKRINL